MNLSETFRINVKMDFVPVFASRPHMGSIARTWTQKYPKNVGTCPGLPLQLLSRNYCFQSDRPEPPLRIIFKFYIIRIYKQLTDLQVELILVNNNNKKKKN